MHLLPLPNGRGSVSRMKYIRSRDRKGAVIGAGDSSAFERGNKPFNIFISRCRGADDASTLNQHLTNNVPGDVRQPEIATHVVICQACMVETQAMQNCRLQIVNMHLVLYH